MVTKKKAELVKTITVATKKKQAEMAKSAIMPFYDYQRKTCIQVGRAAGQVEFIPLDITAGLEVNLLAEPEFDRRFQPMEDYPIVRAAQLYVEYSQNIGATKDALDHLGKIVTISKQEYDMATAKKAASAAVKTTKAAPAKKPAAKAAAPKSATKEKAAAGPKEKKPSASAMFCELIMAGKLTDDQIFAKVQEKFGLSDDKKSYVKWYRNKLTKDGQKPPAAK